MDTDAGIPLENEHDADQVLHEAAAIALFDIRDLFRADGTLLPVHELPTKVAAAVVSMEINEYFSRGEDGQQLIRRTVKIELADKMKALELLGRRLNLFPENAHGVVQQERKDLTKGGATP